MDKPKWNHEPWEIIERMSDPSKKYAGWEPNNWKNDTDQLGLLNWFVKEVATPEQLIKYLRGEIEQEMRDFIDAENAVDCEPEQDGEYPEDFFDYGTDDEDEEDIYQ